MEHRDPQFALWGEFGSSLKDVGNLTLLPLFGEAHAIGVTLQGEDQKRLDFFNKSLLMQSTNKATYLSWATFFAKGQGRNSKDRVETFLAY